MRRSRVIALLAAAALGAPVSVPAQGAPPATDIYLVPLDASGATLRVGAPTNVTRRPGYDNQPSFSPDGRTIYYTAIRDDGQADVWRWDRDRRTAERVTTTTESEYSPTVMPGGRRLSVVRVEADSTQRLWSFALDGSDPRLLLAGVKPVGYHAWADDSTLALFVLGAPSTLQVADTRSGAATVAARDIGRSLVPVPGRHAVSFLQHADSTWWLTILDLDRRTSGGWATERVARMPAGADYAAWLRDGRAITAAGSKLYVLDRATAAWSEFADLASAGLGGLSRLALSPDGRWLALVAEPR